MAEFVKQLENIYLTTPTKVSNEDFKRLQWLMHVKHFQDIASMLKSSHHVIKTKRGKYHLNTCVWSDSECREGPDNCLCYKYISEPETFFFVGERKQVRLRDGHCVWHDVHVCEIVKSIKKSDPNLFLTFTDDYCVGCTSSFSKLEIV